MWSIKNTSATALGFTREVNPTVDRVVEAEM